MNAPQRQSFLTPGVIRGYQLFSFASKAPADNFYTAGPDGEPEGAGSHELAVAGEGIYVVDCPLGWPGRLVLDDSTEHELYPGAVIPDSYSKLSVRGLPFASLGPVTLADSTSPSPAAPVGPWADSPITIAIGPRGAQYRRPGWRYHRWRPATITPNARNRVVAAEVGAEHPPLWILGYDFYTLVYSPNIIFPEANPVVPRVRFRYNWNPPTGLDNPHENTTSTMTETDSFGIEPVNDGLNWFPIFTAGPRVPAAGALNVATQGRGHWTRDYRPATVSIARNQLMPPSGFAGQMIEFALVGGTAPQAPLSDWHFVFYAGVFIP